MSKYRLGYALLRFAGPGDVNGMINLDEDPNERFNPRDLDLQHVTRLAEIFAGDGKRDRVSPIRITLDESLLEAGLREEMLKANPLDPSSTIPPLKLIRPNGVEEDRLEGEIWLRADGNRLLSDNELEQRRQQLQEFRKARPLGKLVNGFHRTRAMIESVKPLWAAQIHICNRERTGADMVTEIRPRMHALLDVVATATYAVEVFRRESVRFLESAVIHVDHRRYAASRHCLPL